MTGTVLTTVVTDDFEAGFVVLRSTLDRHHPGLDVELRILHGDEVAPLSAAARERLARLDPRITFRSVDPDGYLRLQQQRDRVLRTPRRLHAAFTILEAFSFTDAERVVCLDSDMMIVGDLEPLLTSQAPFAAVEATDETGRGLGYFNTGVMVIGRDHLDGRTHDELLNWTDLVSQDRRTGKADQAVLNHHFSGDDVTYLPTAFNVTKRMVPDTVDDLGVALEDLDARILHFVGSKPWQPPGTSREEGYSKAEARWEKAFLRATDNEGLKRYLSGRRQVMRDLVRPA